MTLQFSSMENIRPRKHYLTQDLRRKNKTADWNFPQKSGDHKSLSDQGQQTKIQSWVWNGIVSEILFFKNPNEQNKIVLWVM